MKWFCTDNITLLLRFKQSFLDSTSNRPSWVFSSICTSCALFALLPSCIYVRKLRINVLKNPRERFQSSGTIRRVEWWILTDVSKMWWFLLLHCQAVRQDLLQYLIISNTVRKLSIFQPSETSSRIRIASLCNFFTFRLSFITCSCFKIFYSVVFGYRIL